jgi:hypothetical protein
MYEGMDGYGAAAVGIQLAGAKLLGEGKTGEYVKDSREAEDYFFQLKLLPPADHSVNQSSNSIYILLQTISVCCSCILFLARRPPITSPICPFNSYLPSYSISSLYDGILKPFVKGILSHSFLCLFRSSNID